MPPIKSTLTGAFFSRKAYPNASKKTIFCGFSRPSATSRLARLFHIHLPRASIPSDAQSLFVQPLIASRLRGVTSIWEKANPQLRNLAVYEPGKPIEETARELAVDPSEIIKLASNENPLGPSPKAVKAMRAALEHAHLYPDGSGFYLIKAIAAKLGLTPKNVILGNGSN